MPLKRCPGCRTLVMMNRNVGDFIHDCDIPGVSDSLRKEDVVIIGNWSGDVGGSGNRPAGMVMLAGIENELGLSAKADGARFNELNTRGKRKATHRERSRLTWIENPMEL